MNTARIILDESSYRETLHKLASLKGNEIHRARTQALKMAARKLRSAARRGLYMQYPGARQPSRYKPFKPMGNGIKILKGKSDTMSGVHIMGFFLLKYLENGTGPRYIKGNRSEYTTKTSRRYENAGAYRGAMSGTHWFRTSTEAAKQTIYADMDKYLTTAINKIWNKKH
jgi:hypothetical protein